MTIPDLIPFARYRPLVYRNDIPKFTHEPLGWIPHVVVGYGSPFDLFNRNVKGKRKNAHGWVAKNGSMEQYVLLSYQSWAQVNGNGTYWAFEFEGFPNEPYTDEQIVTAGRIHHLLGVADAIAYHPGERGIGTHYMGGAAWGGHSCPDEQGHEGHGPRSLARAKIIAASHPATPPVGKKGSSEVFAIKLSKNIGPNTASAVFESWGEGRRWIKNSSYNGKMISAGIYSGSPYEADSMDELIDVGGPIQAGTAVPEGWVE